MRVIVLLSLLAVVLPSDVGQAQSGQSCPLMITDPAPLNANAAFDSGHDCSPQLVPSGAGSWLAVWASVDDLGGVIGVDLDVLFSHSTDNGTTWTFPEPLNTNASSDDADDQGPQLATDGLGNWVVVWQSENDLGGTIGIDSDILFSRSNNGGTTWTAPVPLNTNAASDSGPDWNPQLTTDGTGHWLAVWRSHDDLDGTIGTDADILFSRSMDEGSTWTEPQPLNSDAAFDGPGEFDRDPEVATDGGGNWVAIWASSPEIRSAHSTDNGATWSAPVGVSFSGSVADPQLTTDGEGNWLAVWESLELVGSDKDILFALSTDNGLSWTTPQPLNNNALSDGPKDNDLDPQIATDGAGNWVAVWLSTSDLGGTIGSDFDILLSRSTTNGSIWTDPVPLNSNAGSDLFPDVGPQLSTDRAGNWVASWTSNNDFGGIFGNDFDIFSARFQLSTGDKITICHIPPGNPDNPHTITVSVNALPAHLAHGDSCGPCEEDDDLLLRAGESEVCSADVNGDGVVKAADLALLLGTWGPSPTHSADFDNDGVVDAADLAALLGSWGSCE